MQRRWLGVAKLGLFFLCLGLGLLWLGQWWGGRFGLLLGFAIAVIWVLLFWFYSDNRILRAVGAEQLLGEDPWQLRSRCAKLAHQLQLPEPGVFLVPTHSPLAFGLARSQKRPAVCISMGLLQRLKPQEVDAVLVLLLCQVQQMGFYWLSLVHVVANVILGLANQLDRIPGLRRLRPFTHLFSPLAWLILRLVLRDRRFFSIDDLAMSLLPDRRLLAETLWKLDCMAQAEPYTPPPCTAHFFLVNPLGLGERNWFLKAHPRIDLRVRRLIGCWPI